MNFLKNFKISLTAAIAVFAVNSANSQTIGAGTYMFGDIVEVAINNARGMEGAPNVVGYHSRSNIGLANPVYYGFVANPLDDGWTQWDGDFFTPGSPENGFGLEVAGTNYSNNSASTFWNQIPGGLVSYEVIGDCIIVQWEGNVAGVNIHIQYKLLTTDIYYTTTVTLTNTTAGNLGDVYYYRNFDPDNNVSVPGGTYVTTNTVVAQPTPGCDKAYVTATSAVPWASYVGMGGMDPMLRVTRGGFSNRDASNIWNGVGGLLGTLGATTADQAISLAYRIPSFGAGESYEFSFVIVMDAASYDEAMSSLFTLDYEGVLYSDECNPVVDSTQTCAGQPVDISVFGPGIGGYTWAWTPPAGLSTTTGPVTSAGPTTTTTYTVTGTPIACLSTPITKQIVVEVTPAPDISIVDPGPQCESFDLSTLVVNDLNATPGATTSFFSTMPDSVDQTVGMYPPGYIMSPGDSVYVMMGVLPDGCYDVEILNITFDFMPNAGPDNSATNCSGAGVIDIAAMLTGADPGGTWAETTVPPGGGLDAAAGTYDISGLAPGDYTIEYTALGGACPDDVAIITLTVETEVNAGADNTATLCNDPGSTFDLSSLVDPLADAGGTWSETTASGGALDPVTGMYTSGGVPAGVYTFDYTVPAVAPCLTDVATMTITINNLPDAGPDNTSTICNSPGSTIDVNTLVTGDAGGIWAETTVPPSGSFTPATGTFDGSGLAAGDYTFSYTVIGLAPCPTDDAAFTVTITDLPTAGLDNTGTVCNEPLSSIDLNTLLSGADAGGTWSEVTASGSFDPATGIFTSDGVAAGVYTFEYTVAPVGPCPGDVASFDITVQQYADAGADGSATLCNSPGSTMDINTLVTGMAGGTWVETTASGSFTPATGMFDASGLATGVYTFEYTVAGTPPCSPDMAVFNITVTNLPDAGPDNTSSLCNIAGTTLDLDLLVTGDPGGSWMETGPVSGGFTPATGMLDASSVAAGVYTYDYSIPGSGPCPGDVATMTITIEQEAIAGDDNSTDLCNSAGTTLDLNTLLIGAAAGGTWTETGPASGGFTPATGMLDASGVPAGVYTYDYTVAAVAPCVPDVATFTITIQEEVNAGADNVTQECNYSGATVDLTALLDPAASAGGTWAETTSSGGFTPATGILDLTGIAAGVYDFTYTLTAVAPCTDDVANFTVTVNPVPTLNSLVSEEMCDADPHTAQVFGSDVPGSTFDWSNTSGTDIGFGLAGTGNIGSYTGASGSTSDVTVTVEVTPTSPAGCVGTPMTFNITVHPIPVVTFSGDELIGCEPLQVTFTSAGGDPGSTCMWTFGDGTSSTSCGVVGNTFEYAGTYDVGLTVTSAHGCTASEMYTDYITVSPEAEAKFSYSPNGVITIDDTRVEFENSSLNADGYSWDFGDETPGSSETDPTHEFPEIGDRSYVVTLVAESMAGCPDTAYATINIDDIILFFVPNIFTPDGDDYNETFKPVMTAGYDIYDYHLTIFNRWGEIVFESYNAATGWDGTFGDRGLVEDGTYVWQIQFGETMSDKRHTHRGHVTILK